MGIELGGSPKVVSQLTDFFLGWSVRVSQWSVIPTSILTFLHFDLFRENKKRYSIVKKNFKI